MNSRCRKSCTKLCPGDRLASVSKDHLSIDIGAEYSQDPAPYCQYHHLLTILDGPPFGNLAVGCIRTDLCQVSTDKIDPTLFPPSNTLPRAGPCRNFPSTRSSSCTKHKIIQPEITRFCPCLLSLSRGIAARAATEEIGSKNANSRQKKKRNHRDEPKNRG